MLCLVDTNILLRFADRSHPLYPVIRNAVKKLRQDGYKLQVASQNCVEFWNVVTRPIEKNGFGLIPADADRLLRRIERIFPLFPDTHLTYSEWRRLVVTYRVSGVQVHDARLVAIMKANGAAHILTLNVKDFTRYANEGIVPIDPNSISEE
jgi:predicted nucleic acid-binding protein